MYFGESLLVSDGHVTVWGRHSKSWWAAASLRKAKLRELRNNNSTTEARNLGPHASYSVCCDLHPPGLCIAPPCECPPPTLIAELLPLPQKHGSIPCLTTGKLLGGHSRSLQLDLSLGWSLQGSRPPGAARMPLHGAGKAVWRLASIWSVCPPGSLGWQ